MVIQRTIHHLKQRPHHERRTFALMFASIVVAALFLIWAVAFFTGLHSAQVAQQAKETAAANAGVENTASGTAGAQSPPDTSSQ